MTVAWDDEGIVLRARRHGETALVVSAFTFEHGRHAGWIAGAAASRNRPLYEPGNRLQLHWQARLEDDLGRFTAEPIDAFAARVLDRPDRLAAMAAATALLETALAEREAHPTLYAGLLRLFATLAGDEHWRGFYLRFEALLLAETGFALDLERCAVTGRADQLAFVSPRTGRAVAQGAAPDYEDRLLPLPPCLLDASEPDAAAFAQGLQLTGHFLEKHVYHPIDQALPPARQRLAQQSEEAKPLGSEAR
ncbi:MAG: DNA repair protein RecO [Geminicoccaceae bacterium]|nr:MAG: DNA repair protein RecO [Geminicoccaceae bacterium]